MGKKSSSKEFNLKEFDLYEHLRRMRETPVVIPPVRNGWMKALEEYGPPLKEMSKAIEDLAEHFKRIGNEVFEEKLNKIAATIFGVSSVTSLVEINPKCDPQEILNLSTDALMDLCASNLEYYAKAFEKTGNDRMALVLGRWAEKIYRTVDEMNKRFEYFFEKGTE